jgi:ATP-binding cassette subfamily F protein 3
LVEMASFISVFVSRKLTSVNEGVGKSTLLRHIAMREVPIPAYITILFVEQEVKITRPSLVTHSRDPPDCWR